MAPVGKTVGSDGAGNSWPKWTIALAVGAPVAVGLGYWYYRKSRTAPDRNGTNKNEKHTLASLASCEQEISLDGTSVEANHVEEEKDPLKIAVGEKDAGNKFFKNGKYADAIQCYNKAIELCPTDNKTELSKMHQNRAAAYEQLRMYGKVREDCTRALELDPKYVKALQRRAKAAELSKDYQQSLEDVTAACILENFQNQSTLETADRVLKELGRKHAKEAMASKKPVIPSKYFVKTYFSSFSEDPFTNSLTNGENESAEADQRGFARAKEEFKLQHYDDIIPACTEEISSEDGRYKNEAFLLRATFRLLQGEHTEAFEDLKQLIENEDVDVKLRVNALIKRASLYMQLEQPNKSIEDFNTATKIDPDNPDIYHHRGQVHLLLDKTSEAIKDFDKAVELRPDFPIAYVQKCYTDYRYAFGSRDPDALNKVNQAFKDALKKFPKCSECYTLYAQVLSDQERFDEADKYFGEALKIDPENATVYVHRGLLALQWTGDVAKARNYIREALKIDDKCEFAYETLGTIEVQSGNLKEAVELFDKAIRLSKTELEMSHLFSLRDAAVAQITVCERGIIVPNWQGLL